MVFVSYCTKCGNTGIDIDGNPCSCRFNVKSFYDTVSCLDIPEQYRGIRFNSSLVASDMQEGYAKMLQDIHDKILTGKWGFKNVVLASPIGHSKTILAYSCLESLFRHGETTFPVYDVLEIKRILTDMDLCRKPLYEVDQPERVITSRILFVKIPRVTSWEVYDTIALILDRRVRRGNSTIFIFDGSWSDLVYNDKHNVLTGLMGDGYYNTLDVQSWNAIMQPKKELIVEENLG